MINIARTTSIALPAADVFTFVADVRNEPQWHTDLLEASPIMDGPIGEGSTFAVRFKPFMGVSEGKMTISEYNLPRRAVFDVQMGTTAARVTMTIEPEGAGSLITRYVEMQPSGLMRMLAPIMRIMMGKEMAGHLANLKRALETS